MDKENVMTTAQKRAACLHWQWTGTLALLLALLITPLDARGATYDIGTLGTGNQETRSANVSAIYNGWKVTPSTGWISQKHTVEHNGKTNRTTTPYNYVENLHETRGFENRYTFSLNSPRTFFLRLVAFTKSVRDYSEFPNISITLVGKNGAFERNISPYRESYYNKHYFEREISLDAGKYTLIIAGSTFYPDDGYDEFTVDYDGTFGVDGYNPGPDVPLPGALVLLGTAVAGAGVWGRRKAAKAAKVGNTRTAA